jgi:hypothetical protein
MKRLLLAAALGAGLLAAHVPANACELSQCSAVYRCFYLFDGTKVCV